MRVDLYTVLTQHVSTSNIQVLLSYRLVSHFFTNHTHLKFATIVYAYLTKHEFTNKFILHFFYDYSLQCDVNITATSKNAAEEYQNEMKHLFKTVC